MAASFTIPWREVLDFADNFGPIGLARDAVALACRLRQQRPWLFEVAQIAGPPPNPIAALSGRQAWDTVCSLYPPSPPDRGTVPFFGGQCPGVEYQIDIVDPQRGNRGPTSASGVIVGPIEEIVVGYGPSDYTLDLPPVPTGYSVSGISNAGAFVRATDTKVVTPRTDTRSFYFRIRRVDGLPDSCGNITYNIERPVIPPGNTTVIVAPVLGQEREIEITLPDYDVSNWPDFSWNPIIQFDGITVEFATDGVTVNYPDGVSLNPPVNINPVIENINNVNNAVNETVNNIDNRTETMETTINNTNEATTRIENLLQQEFLEINEKIDLGIQDILNAIERCCCKEGVTLDSQTISAATAGGRFSLPEKTVALVFELQLPETPRTPIQDGSGGAARVYHWGSYAVGYDFNSEGDRVPLQWARQAVAVQPYSKCVTIWPTYENIGSITAIYEVSPV